MTLAQAGQPAAAPPSRGDARAFDGGDQQRVRRTIDRLCIVIAIAIVPAMVHNFLAGDYWADTVLCFQELTLGFVLWMNRHGLVHRSADVLCYTTIACATAFVSGSPDGLRDPASLMYPMAIVMGSLMFSLRPFIFVSVAAVACVAGVWAAAQYGLLAVDPQSATHYHYLVDITIIIFITAITSGLVGQHLKASFLESQQSERRFKTIADAAFEGIAVTEDGRFVDANPALCKMLGYELAELTGMEVTGVVSAADREMVVGNIRSGRDSKVEHVMQRKDGTQCIVEAHGRTVAYQGRSVRLTALRDITSRKLAEKALLESEERYRGLVELSPDAIVVHDFQKIVFANSATVALFGGRSPADFIGRNPMDFVHPDSIAQTRERVVALRNARTTIPLTEIRMLRFDGTVIEAEIVSSLLSQTSAFMVQTVVRDVTHRKDAERQKRDLEEQLHQSRKLESIGRMAGGVAHDFNNLLTVINGYAELLLARLPEGDPLADPIGEICKAGERAAKLTRQLLTLSRRQVIEPRPLDLNQLIRDDVELLRRLMGEHIEIVLRLPADLRLTRADSGQIQQVLLNLSANARDAMPEGGRLTIETANVEMENPDAPPMAGTVPGSFVHLLVSDTGKGIDKETQRQIFDPFFTTKRETGGSGLGLAIVYGIVRQSGGVVAVESEPGRGATFHIYLPAAVADPPHPAEPVSGHPVEISGDATVLVVEDQDAVRKFTCESLTRYGFRVLEAASGEDALELVRTHPARIDLLLTDVVMPKMNGRELAGRVTSILTGAKVLYMSGYTEEVIARRGLLEQGLHYIAKPFSPQALAQKVVDALKTAGPAGERGPTLAGADVAAETAADAKPGTPVSE